MTPFIVGLFIMLCGAIFGVILTWFYMNGRVEWWQEKYEMEHRIKEKLLDQNMRVLNEELRIFNDIRSAIQTKGRGL